MSGTRGEYVAPGDGTNDPPFDLNATTIDGSARARWQPGVEDVGSPVPEHIGRYQVGGFVGHGTMGTVYVAHDPGLDRRVAIKLLRNSGANTAAAQHRMLREAQALARLSHPNVVHVYEVDAFKGEIYIAMEYVDGETMRAWLERAPRTREEIVEAYISAGEGLAAAHDAGLTHRDFKPDNILIGRDGRVKVVDFGLVRFGASAEPPEHASSTSAESSLVTGTRTGAILGTPAYMSPEQHQGGTADARSDQFSFCVALHEALNGRRPFAALDLAGLRSEIERGPAAPSGDRGHVPLQLHRALKQGLAFTPGARHPNMRVLLALLRRSIRRSERWVWALTIALVLGVGVTIGWLVLDADRALCTQGPGEAAQAWNDERSAAIRATFAASQLAYAPTTLQRILPQLDAYAGAWSDAYTRSCREHHDGASSAQQLDDRMSCLRARREQLRALVDILVEGSPTAIENAGQAVDGLIPVARCTALDLHQRPRESPSTEIEPEVRAMALDLARIKAQYDAGLYDAGLELSTAVLQRARALNYGPSLAELLFYRGSIHGQKGQYDEAEASLFEAQVLADAHGDDRLRTQSLSLLSQLLGDRQGRPVEGLRAAQLARGALQRLGGDDLLEAWLLIAESTNLRLLERYAAARENAERALELASKHPILSDRWLAHNELAAIALRVKDAATAAHHLEEAIALARRDLGPEHPKLIYLQSNLASFHMQHGRQDEAERILREALASAESSPGARHPLVPLLLDSLGLIQASRDDPRGAIALFERARQLGEADVGATHPSQLAVNIDLLGAQLKLDAIDDAVLSTERAIAVWEANHRVIVYDEDLAELILAIIPKLTATDPARARRYVDVVHAIARAQTIDHQRISLLSGLARLDEGRTRRSRDFLQEALTISGSADPKPYPAPLGLARLHLAETLWNSGERERGLALARSIELPESGADAARAALSSWLQKVQAADTRGP